MNIIKPNRTVHCVGMTLVNLVIHEEKVKQVDEEEEGCVEIDVI
jgi:hypothetical protein